MLVPRASQVVSAVKNPPANAGDKGDSGSVSGLGRSLAEGTATHPAFLLRDAHGQSSLVGYSPRGHKESDMTKRLSARVHTHTHVDPKPTRSHD